MSTVIAYVDGFNLQHGLRAKYGYRYHWLDVPALIRRLRPNDEIIKVRYFTAMVRNKPEVEAAQRAHHAALSGIYGSEFDLVLGHYQPKPRQCRSCDATWTAYEEKETDVNLAVSLVADAARSRSKCGLIISADADLGPAIRAARSIAWEAGNEMRIVTAFPPKRFSRKLKTVVPSAFTLSQADIRNSLLPEEIVDTKAGRVYRRPPKWK